MNKTKNLIIIALAAVIVLGAVGIGVAIYANSPETVMQSSVQNLFEDVFTREEFETVSGILESGSLEMIMSLAAEGQEVSLEYKEYFGLKNAETYIEKLKLELNDFSIEGSAYLSEDYAYVSVPALSDEPLGIVRGKTEKDFSSSIFAFDSDSKYELDETSYDILKLLFRIYDEAKDKEAVKDLEELTNSYIKLILDSLKKHGEIKDENGSVKLDGDSVKARIIKIEIDAECIYNIMKDLYNEVKDDSRIPKLIKKYANLAEKYLEGTSLEGQLQAALNEDEDEDIVELLLEEYDNMLDDFGDTVDDMEDSIDDAGNMKIVIEMATKKTSSTLMALNVEVKEDGEKMEIIDIRFGKNGAKKSDKITADIMGGELSFEFAVKQNDKEAYKSTLSFSEGEEELFEIFAKIDKDGGKFSFGASVEGETYEVAGGYEKSGKKHTFDFKDIIYTDASGAETSLINMFMDMSEEAEIDFELKLIICENEKPKPISKGQVKSVLTLTEDDIADLESTAKTITSDFQAALGLGDVDSGLDTGDDYYGDDYYGSADVGTATAEPTAYMSVVSVLFLPTILSSNNASLALSCAMLLSLFTVIG